MATFTGWLKDQESRDDSTGALARLWAVVTPGKISAPAGIRRVLGERGHHGILADDMALAEEKTGMGFPEGFDWALALDDAITERDAAADNGQRPLAPVPDGPGASRAPVLEQVRADVEAAQGGDGQVRLEDLADALDRIEIMLAAGLGVIAAKLGITAEEMAESVGYSQSQALAGMPAAGGGQAEAEYLAHLDRPDDGPLDGPVDWQAEWAAYGAGQ